MFGSELTCKFKSLIKRSVTNYQTQLSILVVVYIFGLNDYQFFKKCIPKVYKWSFMFISTESLTLIVFREVGQDNLIQLLSFRPTCLTSSEVRRSLYEVTKTTRLLTPSRFKSSHSVSDCLFQKEWDMSQSRRSSSYGIDFLRYSAFIVVVVSFVVSFCGTFSSRNPPT